MLKGKYGGLACLLLPATQSVVHGHSSSLTLRACGSQRGNILSVSPTSSNLSASSYSTSAFVFIGSGLEFRELYSLSPASPFTPTPQKGVSVVVSETFHAPFLLVCPRWPWNRARAGCFTIILWYLYSEANGASVQSPDVHRPFSSLGPVPFIFS